MQATCRWKQCAKHQVVQQGHCICDACQTKPPLHQPDHKRGDGGPCRDWAEQRVMLAAVIRNWLCPLDTLCLSNMVCLFEQRLSEQRLKTPSNVTNVWITTSPAPPSSISSKHNKQVCSNQSLWIVRMSMNEKHALVAENTLLNNKQREFCRSFEAWISSIWSIYFQSNLRYDYKQ